MMLDNVRVREDQSVPQRWEGGRHRRAGPSLPPPPTAESQAPPLWSDIGATLRSLSKLGKQKFSKLFKAMEMASSPLSKVVSPPAVRIGRGGRRGRDTRNPGKRATPAMSGRSQEERWSASGKQGPRHQQSPGHGRRDADGP